jgi:cation diffusion facilitator family transporter
MEVMKIIAGRIMQQTTQEQVRRVLLTTLILNLVVALGKIIIGLVTGALAITADGLHSIIDSSGNVLGLVATRIADRPPDEDHPYGHGRYETLAALAIGALLLVTAGEIIQGALERLNGGKPPEITPLAFAVMISTLMINVFVSRYQIREGKRLGSQVLLADAANTSADVFVTISVLVSMALVVALGWQWADIAAALVITVLIGRAAWQVLSQTGRVLVDTAPYPSEQLTQLIHEVPSVENVARVRSRGPLNAAHIDVDVQVAPEMTANQTAAIATAIREKLTDELNGVSEVEVHFEPNQAAEPDYALAARARADALGLSTHEVHVTDMPNGKVLEMHVEVPPDQTLDAAHHQVSQLENDVRRNMPEVVEVITHIEPALTERADSLGDESISRHATQLESRALYLLQAHYPGLDWHHLRVHPYNQGFSIAMHVTLPPQITVEAAHRIAEDAEILLRAEMPQLERVTIHTEPPDES